MMSKQAQLVETVKSEYKQDAALSHDTGHLTVPVIHTPALGTWLRGGGGLCLAAPAGLIQVGLGLSSSCTQRNNCEQDNA